MIPDIREGVSGGTGENNGTRGEYEKAAGRTKSCPLNLRMIFPVSTSQIKGVLSPPPDAS